MFVKVLSGKRDRANTGARNGREFVSVGCWQFAVGDSCRRLKRSRRAPPCKGTYFNMLAARPGEAGRNVVIERLRCQGNTSTLFLPGERLVALGLPSVSAYGSAPARRRLQHDWFDPHLSNRVKPSYACLCGVFHHTQPTSNWGRYRTCFARIAVRRIQMLPPPVRSAAST